MESNPKRMKKEEAGKEYKPEQEMPEKSITKQRQEALLSFIIANGQGKNNERDEYIFSYDDLYRLSTSIIEMILPSVSGEGKEAVEQDELWNEIIDNVGGDNEQEHKSFLRDALKSQFIIQKR